MRLAIGALDLVEKGRARGIHRLVTQGSNGIYIISVTNGDRNRGCQLRLRESTRKTLGCDVVVSIQAVK